MVELLSPAANLKSGLAAVEAGADALYVGAEVFGARQKAGNSLEDIGQLCRRAHLFGVRVYLTVNTVLYDVELCRAEELIWQAWQSGVDALIVQDMGLLEMSLPPVELHASTQTFNLTPDKVRWLEDVGFQRVVLERSLSVKEIRKIREATNVELEAFVHGAICVGYSGQCYLSEALCHRSGNRGACAQPCRSLWNLYRSGRLIEQNKALLSVSDMNLSDRLAELVDAGVTSLKIEGRLKDENYVVNNTAYYSNKINELGFERVSKGTSTALFTPDPTKSFSRRFSTFLFDKRKPTTSLLNGTSGEFIGKIVAIGRDYIELDRNFSINNGDGLSFAASGTNVNASEGRRIFPNAMNDIELGVEVYRNFDNSFKPSAVRKIDVDIEFLDGIIVAKDSTELTAHIEYQYDELANNSERAAENIRVAMGKGGDTIFEVVGVEVLHTPFLPISKLNDLRRNLLGELTQKRFDQYQRPIRKTTIAHPELPVAKIDYRYNVTNRLSRQFYEKCGAIQVEQGYEFEAARGAELMRTRHCIRRELGLCGDQESLYIENNGRRFILEFDCRECEMMIINYGRNSKNSF